MAGTLSAFSDALAATVQAASASVVRVDARTRRPASGIIYADGVIVTAHHVLETEQIQIGLPSGETVPATLVGRDPTTDTAVLRAQTGGHRPAAFNDGESLGVGHLVLALGRPGQSIRATHGIISALGGSWRTPIGGRVDRYFQPDVAMYPGFSGGPLVDVDGQVLGMNTSAMLRGVSITIPVATLRRVAQAILTHGHIRRGYLGVTAQAVRLPDAVAQRAGQETGLLLLGVEPGSPADGKLLQGDTILAIAGQSARHLDDLLTALTSDRIGQQVSVRVVRGGQLQDVAVAVGERGE